MRILNKQLRQKLFKKVAFDQRLESNKGKGHKKIGGRRISARGNGMNQRREDWTRRKGQRYRQGLNQVDHVCLRQVVWIFFRTEWKPVVGFEL